MLKLRSNDSLIVEARMRELEVGQSLAYSELSKLIGSDVRRCRHVVTTALKHLLEDNIHFVVDRGQGYIRIDHASAVKNSSTYLQRARGACRRGLKVLQHTEFKELDDDSKKQHLVTSAQLGLIHEMASAKSTKKIAAEVQNNQVAINQNDLLKLFQKRTT
jgi:hypothetical protein